MIETVMTKSYIVTSPKGHAHKHVEQLYGQLCINRDKFANFCIEQGLTFNFVSDMISQDVVDGEIVTTITYTAHKEVTQDEQTV